MLHMFNEISASELLHGDDVISTSQVLQQQDGRRIAEAIPKNFFERLVSMLPMHVPKMTNRDTVRTLEVLVKRQLGGQRLFDHYIYLKIERNVLRFTTDEYCRTVRALADKHFVNDSVFWGGKSRSHCRTFA